MKLIKILTALIALASLQIAAAQWLEVPPPAEARMLMVQGGVPVAGGTTYIYVGGSDDFSDATGSESACLGDSVVLGGAVTIIELGVKLSDKQSATTCWVALYNADGDSLLAHGHFTPANGWNAATISYGASAATYTISFICDSAIKLSIDSDGTGTVPFYYVTTYGDYPNPPPSGFAKSGSSGNFGLRIGY
jgi:hypothetical protein